MSLIQLNPDLRALLFKGLIILIIFLAGVFVSSLVTAPKNRQERKQWEKELKQIQIENDGLKVLIKDRQLLIEKEKQRIKQVDSLLQIKEQQLVELRKGHRYEIQLLKEKLKNKTPKEKEQLIIDYYEKAN